MRLCKENSYNVTHIMEPRKRLQAFSFCGLVGHWPMRSKTELYKFFNGTLDQVNCATCKVMAHNYIIRKLKGENYAG